MEVTNHYERMKKRMEQKVGMKTYEAWKGNLDEYLQIGDFVDEEFVEYFRNVLPPAYDSSRLIQIGEPNSHIEGRATYATLSRLVEGWVFAGHCFRGEDFDRS